MRLGWEEEGGRQGRSGESSSTSLPPSSSLLDSLSPTPKLTHLPLPLLSPPSPYTGTSLTCYLSQSANALYILGASSSSPSDIYIYSFASSSWSTQPTSSAPDLTTASTGSVLDHDTNTFFTLAGGTALSQLDLSTVGDKSGGGGSLAWEGVNTAPFTSTVSLGVEKDLGWREGCE